MIEDRWDTRLGYRRLDEVLRALGTIGKIASRTVFKITDSISTAAWGRGSRSDYCILVNTQLASTLEFELLKALIAHEIYHGAAMNCQTLGRQLNSTTEHQAMNIAMDIVLEQRLGIFGWREALDRLREHLVIRPLQLTLQRRRRLTLGESIPLLTCRKLPASWKIHPSVLLVHEYYHPFEEESVTPAPVELVFQDVLPLLKEVEQKGEVTHNSLLKIDGEIFQIRPVAQGSSITRRKESERTLIDGDRSIFDQLVRGTWRTSPSLASVLESIHVEQVGRPDASLLSRLEEHLLLNFPQLQLREDTARMENPQVMLPYVARPSPQELRKLVVMPQFPRLYENVIPDSSLRDHRLDIRFYVDASESMSVIGADQTVQSLLLALMDRLPDLPERMFAFNTSITPLTMEMLRGRNFFKSEGGTSFDEVVEHALTSQEPIQNIVLITDGLSSFQDLTIKRARKNHLFIHGIIVRNSCFYFQALREQNAHVWASVFDWMIPTKR